MKVVTTPEVEELIRARGGKLWVWLDPHRGMIGSHIWLEAQTEPPGTSRRTKFTRSSRRPHSFDRLEADGFVLHHDFGRHEMPDELKLELRGWVNKRIEAFWNGCVFVDDAPLDPN